MWQNAANVANVAIVANVADVTKCRKMAAAKNNNMAKLIKDCPYERSSKGSPRKFYTIVKIAVFFLLLKTENRDIFPFQSSTPLEANMGPGGSWHISKFIESPQ